jgi:hypothetical protein
MPTELIGTWRTNHPKYAGLYFQIESDKFAFSTVEGTVKKYGISKYERVEEKVKRKGVSHVLYGKREGRDLKIVIYYEPASGGAIRFKNQERIFWAREGTPVQ